MRVATAIALASCEGKGAGITQRIEAADSPLIAEVSYAPQNNIVGHAEDLYIFLVPDVTDSQIVEAWCQVIVPAGVDQLPADRVWLLRAGTPDPGNLAWGSSTLEKPGNCGWPSGAPR